MNFDISKIDWQKGDGLIPAVVQNHENGKVLMLGYLNAAALEKTIADKKVTFFSRSKQRLWTKGETSGNFLQVIDISSDCDQDSLLILAKPHGPTCHLNNDSCFNDINNDKEIWQTLLSLEKVISDRANVNNENSYTATLLKQGINRVAQKVGEEAVEVVIAALSQDKNKTCEEIADLLYHLLVLMQNKQISLSEVMQTLLQRQKK